MPAFQFFFDYECPFCKRGYEDLMGLLPYFPGTEIEYRPIEAHPRPETYGIHTDLCIQAYYIAVELGADMDVFSRALFKAVVVEGRNVEKAEVLADVVKSIVDKDKLLDLIKSGKYVSKVDENNSLAYDKNGVWYVPAFRVPGSNTPRLDAKGGVGVSREEIRGFLEKCKS